MAGMTQSMQMLEKAKSKFAEAREKFPTYADGLILYALVSFVQCSQTLISVLYTRDYLIIMLLLY